jgi:acetylornithine deacetylase
MPVPERVRSALGERIDTDRDESIEFLRSLVRNPTPEGEGEGLQEGLIPLYRETGADITDLFTLDIEQLSRHPGFSPITHELSSRPIDQKPILVGRFPGQGNGRSLMFYGHLETATPHWEPATVERLKHPPFDAVIDDGKIYGRGAYNMKAGMAAAMMAVRAMRRARIRLAGDVLIHSNLDEDTGSNGALATVLRGYTADAGINPEPTGLWICPATGGPLWFRIVVRGVAAFAGVSYAGVNAIEKGFKVYEAIRSFELMRQADVHHPLFDQLPNPVSTSVGVFRAGNWPANVPEVVTIEGRTGCIPGEDFGKVREAFERQISAVAVADPWLRHHPPEVQWLAHWEACETPTDHPFVKDCTTVFRQVTNSEPIVCAKTAGNDMTKFVTYGKIPSVNLGPCGGPFIYKRKVDLMTQSSPLVIEPDEYVEIESYITLIKIYASVMASWCGVQ